MTRRSLAFILLVSHSLRVVSSDVTGTGEPVVYFPPFELRAVPNQRNAFGIPFRPIGQTEFRRPKVLPHHIRTTTTPAPIEEPEPEPDPEPESEPEHVHETHRTKAEDKTSHNHTLSAVHDLLSALGLTDKEKSKSRDAEDVESAKSEKRYPYEPYQQDYGNGYPERGYDHGNEYGSDHGYSHGPDRGYWQSRPYYGPHSYGSHSYGPPTYVHQHMPAYSPQPPPPKEIAPKPDKLSALLALKPVVTAAKPIIADKIVSIIGGIKSFLGKDFTGSPVASNLLSTLVDGIIKPLFTAKAAVKSLIGKIVVPIIILVLVNIEMLILMWWLWEDCKTTVVPVSYKPAYSSPAPYDPYTRYR